MRKGLDLLEALRPDHAERGRAEALLGRCLVAEGKEAEGEAHLAAGYGGSRRGSVTRPWTREPPDGRGTVSTRRGAGARRPLVDSARGLFQLVFSRLSFVNRSTSVSTALAIVFSDLLRSMLSVS